MNVSGSTPLWLGSRTLLIGQGDEFFRHLTKAEKTFEVEDIHDLRVASRRLREGIALFAPCFPAGNFAKLEKQVKKVTRLLGVLRNTDEAIIFFSELAKELVDAGEPRRMELLDELGREREVARKRVKRGLRAVPPEPLLEEYRSARDRPLIFDAGKGDPFIEIREFAREAILARAATVAELVPQAAEEGEAAAQHQLRIAVKRERYRLEILAPLVKCDYDELHATLKKYQEVLGKMHDMDVFAEIVQDRVPEGESQEALLTTIRTRREKLFRSFLQLLRESPLVAVGERAASAM